MLLILQFISNVVVAYFNVVSAVTFGFSFAVRQSLLAIFAYSLLAALRFHAMQLEIGTDLGLCVLTALVRLRSNLIILLSLVPSIIDHCLRCPKRATCLSFP